jgi:hypothetical protein
MPHLCCKRRTTITISLLLAGFLVDCSFHFLPAIKAPLKCAEERLLETVDDDPNESREVDWTLCAQSCHQDFSRTTDETLGFDFSLASRLQWGAHLLRGPPLSLQIFLI